MQLKLQHSNDITILKMERPTNKSLPLKKLSELWEISTDVNKILSKDECGSRKTRWIDSWSSPKPDSLYPVCKSYSWWVIWGGRVGGGKLKDAELCQVQQNSKSVWGLDTALRVASRII